jgi:hypothetical protein
MSSNQYLKEYLSMTVIGNFHREAALAEQRRLARAGRPNRGVVNSMLKSARQAISRDAASRTELIDLSSEGALIK